MLFRSSRSSTVSRFPVPPPRATQISDGYTPTECSFKGLSSSENIWLPRDELIRRGFEKKVMEVDTREAQKAGLLRPLVRREIELHCADFGLEAEFVSHNTMVRSRALLP